MIYKGIDLWNGPPLMHYGVKGMKWGVRNDKTSSNFRRFPRRRTVSMEGRNVKKAGLHLRAASTRVLKTVSDADRMHRLYKRAVSVGRNVSMSPAMRQYGALAVAGIAAHPAVAVGVAAVAGSAILGYGIYRYNMSHDDMQDDYLAHYGVKGMKWGVRKVRDTISKMRRRREERRIVRDERREQLRVERNAKAIASGNPREIERRIRKMTNEEIQVAINRLNMQKRVYELDRELDNYKAQEKSNSFFGKLMANRQQNTQQNNFNNQNKEKGIVGKAIDRQIEYAVNNAADAAVSSIITGNSFSDTFKKKYGYKTTAEKFEDNRRRVNERYRQDVENVRNQLSTLAIKNELNNVGYKSNRVKNARQLYETDMENLMSNISASDINDINFNIGNGGNSKKKKKG